jgi:hypothetical protein
MFDQYQLVLGFVRHQYEHCIACIYTNVMNLYSNNIDFLWSWQWNLSGSAELAAGACIGGGAFLGTARKVLAASD